MKLSSRRSVAVSLGFALTRLHKFRRGRAGGYSANLGLLFRGAIEILGAMNSCKNIGILLLAIYLIVDSLVGFGLNIGGFIFLIYLLGLAGGTLILIGFFLPNK